MNGEIVNLIKLVSSTKVYLREGTFTGVEDGYVKSVRFLIKRKSKSLFWFKNILQTSISQVGNSYEEWIHFLQEDKTTDISLSMGMPMNQDFHIAGFSNSNSSWCIITHREDGDTVWYKKWEFSNIDKKWEITFFGIDLESRYEGSQESDVNSVGEIQEALVRIRDFARDIDETHWEKYFEKARKNLDNNELGNYLLPDSYPEMSIKLLNTISSGWCFGGMGSWNDSPPYSAHLVGKDDEFKEVTKRWYECSLNAIVSIVNSY